MGFKIIVNQTEVFTFIEVITAEELLNCIVVRIFTNINTNIFIHGVDLEREGEPRGNKGYLWKCSTRLIDCSQTVTHTTEREKERDQLDHYLN